MLAGPGGHRVVPMAGVAKVITAYVMLHDHPLRSARRAARKGTQTAMPQVSRVVRRWGARISRPGKCPVRVPQLQR
jgi:hypothetical protein